MTQTKTRALTEGALMVAAATALSYVKLLELPQGGSVCIGMLPIFLYCARWGCKESFLASFAYGLLQLIFDGAYAWGPTSMLLDYVLAYGVLGVACLFRKQKGGVYIGTVVGCLCRFLVHFISGITIYRIYEPTELFNTTFANPYIYSAAYNGSYMVIDLVLCLVITALLYRPLSRYFAPQEAAAAAKKNQGPELLKRRESLSPPTDCRESRSKRNGSPAFIDLSAPPVCRRSGRWRRSSPHPRYTRR
ncbi:MAG: energy-coupled thiamine transporter ThiT [Oscillospiraceae bacterium]